MVRAAIAIMRPNWPPPKMAIRPPGRITADVEGAEDSESIKRATPDPALPGCVLHATPPAVRRAPRRWWPKFPLPAGPALAAPGLPMASVPTGTPLGICTMESSESMPMSCVAAIGTPSTGDQRFGRQHARQMRRAAGSGNNHPQPARPRRCRVLEEPVGGAMRTHDLGFMRNFKNSQYLHGRREHLIVRSCCPSPRPPTGLFAHNSIIRAARMQAEGATPSRLHSQRKLPPTIRAAG